MHGGGDLGHGDTRAAGVYSGDAGCQLSCSTLLRRRIAAQAAVAEALWFLVEQTETSEAARGRWTVAAGTYAISTRWLVGQFTRGRACRKAVVCVCVCTLFGQDVCFRVGASPWWNLGTTMVTRPARM